MDAILWVEQLKCTAGVNIKQSIFTVTGVDCRLTKRVRLLSSRMRWGALTWGLVTSSFEKSEKFLNLCLFQENLLPFPFELSEVNLTPVCYFCVLLV